MSRYLAQLPLISYTDVILAKLYAREVLASDPAGPAWDRLLGWLDAAKQLQPVCYDAAIKQLADHPLDTDG